MEDQCSPFSWDFCYQLEEGIEDQLRHSLLYTTLELETTIISAKEKISRKEEEVVRLKDLLSRVIKERDEAEAKCQSLVLDKLLLQQELQKHQVFAPQNHEVESKGSDSNKHFVASSDSDENIISSPNADPIMSQDVLTKLLGDQKALPEKGKLLQAVIEAGPLLQTLLLAGPLPQWQHPPPQLKSIEIPPVAISPPTPHLLHHQDSCISTSSNKTCFGNKRSLLHCDGSGSDSSPKNTKYQKERVHFHNTGPSSVPGVIVMSIADGHEGVPGLSQLCPIYSYIVVIVNASPTEVSFTSSSVRARTLQLHPVQVMSTDEIVKRSTFDTNSGCFIVPARTTSVFVEPRGL